MRRRAFAGLVLAAGMGVVTGCDVSTSWVDERAFLGTHWKAVSVAGEAPTPGQEPTLELGPVTLSGSTGCNAYQSGTLQVDPPAFGFEGLTVGEIVDGPCVDARARAIADAYVSALVEANRIEILADGRLQLSGPLGELVFVPIPGTE